MSFVNSSFVGKKENCIVKTYSHPDYCYRKFYVARICNVDHIEDIVHFCNYNAIRMKFKVKVISYKYLKIGWADITQIYSIENNLHVTFVQYTKNSLYEIFDNMLCNDPLDISFEYVYADYMIRNVFGFKISDHVHGQQ